MYKVLVAYATRMGSTREIAAAIGEVLTDAGCDVDVQPCSLARHAGAYDAVIIGSALYLGRWEKSGTAYLRRNAWALSELPTWLFQSGPCGNSTISEVETPRAIKQLSDQIGLGKPQTFGGKLDRTKATGPLSRWMATGTFSGDFRDWEQIRQWATSVAHHLNSDNVSSSTE